jgi:hypothetical protein
MRMLVEARRVSEINPDHSVSLTLAQKISCGHAARVPGPIADWRAKKRCSPPTSTSPASPVAKIITPLRRPRLASRSFRDRDKSRVLSENRANYRLPFPRARNSSLSSIDSQAAEPSRTVFSWHSTDYSNRLCRQTIPCHGGRNRHRSTERIAHRQSRFSMNSLW